jgi:hypothetical protein
MKASTATSLPEARIDLFHTEEHQLDREDRPVTLPEDAEAGTIL